MRCLLLIAVMGCRPAPPVAPTPGPAAEPDEHRQRDQGAAGAMFARACELGDMAGCGYQATLLVDYLGHASGCGP